MGGNEGAAKAEVLVVAEVVGDQHAGGELEVLAEAFHQLADLLVGESADFSDQLLDLSRCQLVGGRRSLGGGGVLNLELCWLGQSGGSRFSQCRGRCRWRLLSSLQDSSGWSLSDR